MNDNKQRIINISRVDHELTILRKLVGKKHTFLSFVILSVLFFLIGYIGYSHLWDGAHFDSMDDFFELHHHAAILNLSLIMGYEHPLLELHESCDAEGHVHTSDPQHHSNLERLMHEMEHKHHYYLWIAFHVQIFVVVTSFLKLFFLVDKTWEWMLNALIVLVLISTFFQFIGCVAIIFILYHIWCTTSVFLIIGQIWLTIVELGSFLALWTIRQKLNYLKHHHFKFQQNILAKVNHIKKNSDHTELQRAATEILSTQDHFSDFIKSFLFKFKDNLTNLSLSSNKQKRD